MNTRATVLGSPLTEKELKCVEWLAEGKTIAEISIILGAKRNTVMKRLESAKAYADVSKDTALVAKAIRQGWIQ